MSQTPVPITGGSGSSSIAAELVGSTSYQQIEVYGGGGSSVLGINPDGSIKVSVIGNIFIGGSVLTVGTVAANQSVSGTVGASIIGNIPVVVQGSVATVIIGGSILTSSTANQSVSGTVGASVIGTIPVTQSGAWTTSVVGGPVTLYAPTTSLVSGVTSIMTGTASVLVLAAAAGGQRNYVTQILVTNGAATATFVDVVDNGAIIYSGYAAASGGGFSASFPAPLRQPSTVSALYTATRAQASVIVSMSGYTAP